MDWTAEAKAVIDDIKPYVSSIEISEGQESSEMRIFFDITILEGKRFVVSMDSNGFCICDDNVDELGQPNHHYETINALLDANSVRYREEFSKALTSKISQLDRR